MTFLIDIRNVTLSYDSLDKSGTKDKNDFNA